MRELVKFQRGVYTPEEQAALDAWKAGTYKQSGPPMMMGAGKPKEIDTVSAFEMYYYAQGWDKWNPLWSDYNYAKDTWYGDNPAIPTIREPMAMAQLPSELGFESTPSTDPLVGDLSCTTISPFSTATSSTTAPCTTGAWRT